MSAGQADSPHSTHTHARARSSYGVINTVPPLHVYVSINGHRGNVLSPAQMSLLSGSYFLIVTLCMPCSPLWRAAIALMFIPVTFACSVIYLEKNIYILNRTKKHFYLIA